jgi:hypothetical protein
MEQNKKHSYSLLYCTANLELEETNLVLKEVLIYVILPFEKNF